MVVDVCFKKRFDLYATCNIFRYIYIYYVCLVLIIF